MAALSTGLGKFPHGELPLTSTERRANERFEQWNGRCAQMREGLKPFEANALDPESDIGKMLQQDSETGERKALSQSFDVGHYDCRMVYIRSEGDGHIFVNLEVTDKDSDSGNTIVITTVGDTCPVVEPKDFDINQVYREVTQELDRRSAGLRMKSASKQVAEKPAPALVRGDLPQPRMKQNEKLRWSSAMSADLTKLCSELDVLANDPEQRLYTRLGGGMTHGVKEIHSGDYKYTIEIRNASETRNFVSITVQNKNTGDDFTFSSGNRSVVEGDFDFDVIYPDLLAKVDQIRLGSEAKAENYVKSRQERVAAILEAQS